MYFYPAFAIVSAAAPVQVARCPFCGCASGIFHPWASLRICLSFWGKPVQTRLFGGERDSSVLQHEAGNADAAVPAGLVEDRAAVPQAEEGLEVPYVLSDVDYLVSVIIPDLFFDTGAVGAGVHSVDSDHGSDILDFFRENRHLNEIRQGKALLRNAILTVRKYL